MDITDVYGTRTDRFCFLSLLVWSTLPAARDSEPAVYFLDEACKTLAFVGHWHWGQARGCSEVKALLLYGYGLYVGEEGATGQAFSEL